MDSSDTRLDWILGRGRVRLDQLTQEEVVGIFRDVVDTLSGALSSMKGYVPFEAHLKDIGLNLKWDDVQDLNDFKVPAEIKSRSERFLHLITLQRFESPGSASGRALYLGHGSVWYWSWAYQVSESKHTLHRFHVHEPNDEELKEMLKPSNLQAMLAYLRVHVEIAEEVARQRLQNVSNSLLQIDDLRTVLQIGSMPPIG